MPAALDISVVIPVRNAEGAARGVPGLGRRLRPGRDHRRGRHVHGRHARHRPPPRRHDPLRRGQGPALRAHPGRASARRTRARAAARRRRHARPTGALAALLDEFEEGGYTALQAGLHSVGGPGYWGQALAYHHRTGRSKNWFGLVATIFERDVLLEHGFDASLPLGRGHRAALAPAAGRLAHRRLAAHGRARTASATASASPSTSGSWTARASAAWCGKHRLRGLPLLGAARWRAPSAGSCSRSPGASRAGCPTSSATASATTSGC